MRLKIEQNEIEKNMEKNMNESFRVIILQKNMYKKAIDVLSEAFLNDELLLSIFKSNKKRNFKILFSLIFNLYDKHIFKGVFNEKEELIGVAIVLKPGHKYSILKAALLSIKSIFQMGIKNFTRLMKYTSEEDKYINEDNYFLHYMGVLPDYQNKGFGRILLNACSEEISNLPISLLAVSNKNIDFYKKNGFKVINDFDIFGIHSRLMININNEENIS